MPFRKVVGCATLFCLIACGGSEPPQRLSAIPRPALPPSVEARGIPSETPSANDGGAPSVPDAGVDDCEHVTVPRLTEVPHSIPWSESSQRFVAGAETSDGLGNVITDVDPLSGLASEWEVVAPDGGVTALPGIVGSYYFPQRDGFLILSEDYSGEGSLTVLGGDGTVHAQRPLAAYSGGLVSADPRGGIVLAERDASYSWNLVSLSADGSERWRVPVSFVDGVRVEVDALSNVLLITMDARGASWVAWFDSTGASLGPAQPFALPSDSEITVLKPRVGGGFFVQMVNDDSLGYVARWALELRGPLDHPRPAPQWLVDSQAEDLVLIQGGQAYAAISSYNADHIEIRGVAGSLCGTVSFPAPPTSDDHFSGITIGADGTLVLGMEHVVGYKEARAWFQWWPHAFSP